MATTGDGLWLTLNAYFSMKYLLVGLLCSTNLIMTEHSVSHSKINLVTKKYISKISDYKALSHIYCRYAQQVPLSPRQ